MTKNKRRPNRYRTESEAWAEDTKTIESVEKIIGSIGITKESHFDLFSKISNVSDRTSLSSDPEYLKRLVYCEELLKKITNFKKDTNIISKSKYGDY